MACGNKDNSKLVAVELEFSLPPSAYATMLIREVLRTSTAKDFHAKLGGAENNKVGRGLENDAA